MSIRMRLSLALCGAALSCFAQGVQVGGPITGLVYDIPSKSLRQILGMPGAARLSPPLMAGLDWASVAPDGRTALAVMEGESRLVLSKDIGQDSAGTPVLGLLKEPQISIWAEDSSAVAVYSAASRAMQWVRLNGETAEAGPAIPLTGMDGEVTAMVVDKASEVAVVSAGGKGVYLIGPSGSATPLLAAVDASALLLEPGGQTLWVADRSNSRLVQVTRMGVNPEFQVLLSDPEKLADLSAIGLSSDQLSLYLASRSTQQLYRFDRAAGVLSEGLALDVPANAMTPLGRSTLRLLGQRNKLGQPLFLLDERSGPGLYFVPAGEGEQQ